MCTLLTIDRQTFTTHPAETIWRIKADAALNRDGLAVVALTANSDEVTKFQTLDLNTVIQFIENNQSWTRIFLHTRAATTKFNGIFGCHNFTSVGKGVNKAPSNWIVQHNGILTDPESDKYLVDSMYIAEHIHHFGVKETADYLIEKEFYANVFMIDPESGAYHVVRCIQGTLYTDNAGNYSSKPFGPIKSPVAHNVHRNHVHAMKIVDVYDKWATDYGWGPISAKEEKVEKTNWSSYWDEESVYENSGYRDAYAPSGRNYYSSIDAKGNRMLTEVIEDLMSDDGEEEYYNDILASDILAFGDDALLMQEERTTFVTLCEKLGFGVSRKIPNKLYSQLSKEQKGWFMRFKEQRKFADVNEDLQQQVANRKVVNN